MKNVNKSHEVFLSNFYIEHTKKFKFSNENFNATDYTVPSCHFQAFRIVYHAVDKITENIQP